MKKSALILVTLLALFFTSSNTFSQNKEAEFKPSGKVWGYFFGDFAYKTGGSANMTFGSGEYAKMKVDESKFAFRRIYLGYDYKMAPNFTGKLLLESGDGVLTGDGRRTIFIKAAELEWKDIIPNASLFIGQTSTPTWSLITEKVWGYRSVEKTIADFRKMGKSNDFGLRLTGKFKKDGILGYTLMLGNGTAEKIEFDKFKKVYGSLSASLLDNKLILEAQGDFEKSTNSKGVEVGTTTYKGLIAYETEKFSIGVEPIMQVQDKVKNNQTADMKPFALSMYARGILKEEKLAAFVRFDTYNFDADYTTTDAVSNPYDEKFFLLGFDFTPNANMHIMPNIWINSYEDKRPTQTERKADVVARLSFFFNFK